MRIIVFLDPSFTAGTQNECHFYSINVSLARKIWALSMYWYHPDISASLQTVLIFPINMLLFDETTRYVNNRAVDISRVLL